VNSPAQKPGYAAMSVVFGLVFFFVWIGAFAGTWENKTYANKGDKMQMKEWLDVFKNRSYRNFLGIFIFVQISIDLLLALLVFYIDIVLMKYELYSLFMGIVLAGQLVFMFVFGKVAEKKGKRFPLFVGIPVFILALILIFFLNANTPVPLVCCVCLLVPVGTAAGNVSVWSMLSDLYDTGELMSGKRREGLYSSVTTFLYKLSSGLAILIIGLGLGAAGFDQNEYNVLKALGQIDFGAYETSSIVTAIRGMLSGFPLLFQLAALCFLLRYKLDNRRFALVRKAVQAFKDSDSRPGTDEPSPEALAALSDEEKKDLELVTGKALEQLWGRKS
jgi:Na+/melibiose symporter-like transporter